MARSKTLYALSGRLGMTQGFDTNQGHEVTEDNDGDYGGSPYGWVVDISHVLSENLGKQMPMMATYRVKGLHLSLRNVDNALDNDSSLAIGGTVSWYSPTKHRIDALQHARTFKRKAGMALNENSNDDPFAPWANDKKYKGLRFNWSADSQVSSATPDDTSVLAGTAFSMYEIFDHYNQAIGGDPINAGYDDAGGEGDALWDTRVGLNHCDQLFWNCSYQNRILDKQGALFTPSTDADDSWFFAPEAHPWDATIPDGNCLSVLGGLLKITASHSNTDTAGITEDEYYIQCSVLVEGWEEF